MALGWMYIASIRNRHIWAASRGAGVSKMPSTRGAARHIGCSLRGKPSIDAIRSLHSFTASGRSHLSFVLCYVLCES
jgi:hypothetical protein